MDLQFGPGVSSFQIKEMLTSYKENIISLNIPLRIDPEILLKPDLELTNIERLDIDFRDVDNSLHICENIMARYADKLEHLGVKNLRKPGNTVIQVPNLTKLKSLTFNSIYKNIMNTFVNAVNKDNITHLSLKEIGVYSDILQLDNIIFPHLNYLKLHNIHALSLFKCNMDINIPKLRHLDIHMIRGNAALTLMKCNKEKITELKLSCVKFTDTDNADLILPKLCHLELKLISDDDALFLIKCNKETITKLSLYDIRYTSLPVVEMPRLQHLYLKEYQKDKIILFITAFGRNLTGLWMYDFYKDVYTRKSTEELNNLKMAALASQ